MAILESTELPPPRPEYDISGWETGDDDFFLNVRVRSARFNIYISPENFQRSPAALRRLHNNMEKMRPETDDSGSADLWDYLDWIVATFLPSFQHHAPAVKHSGKLTLAHLYTRQYYECQLHVTDEIPSAGPITAAEPNLEDECEEEQYNAEGSFFPTLALSEVEVPYDDPTTIFDIIPEKVMVQNHVLFWKPSYGSELSKEEVDKYAKIAQSGLPPDQLCTSRLYGVGLSRTGLIRGLLYHWIEIEETLTWAVDERTPIKTREKYASQIKNTVDSLHRLNIVWGDVKAGNVLIDKDGNAIVIDFEGGSTRKWVDKEKAGTIEGDLQGLERLMDYIFNDESILRPSEDDEPEFDDDYSGGEVKA